MLQLHVQLLEVLVVCHNGLERQLRLLPFVLPLGRPSLEAPEPIRIKGRLLETVAFGRPNEPLDGGLPIHALLHEESILSLRFLINALLCICVNSVLTPMSETIASYLPRSCSKWILFLMRQMAAFHTLVARAWAAGVIALLIQDGGGGTGWYFSWESSVDISRAAAVDTIDKTRVIFDQPKVASIGPRIKGISKNQI